MAGIEPTGRGSPVPLVLKTREATRPRSPPLASCQGYSLRNTLRRKEITMKKLLLLVVVLALGAAVAYKVRGDA